jgi:hypothetical protein
MTGSIDFDISASVESVSARRDLVAASGEIVGTKRGVCSETMSATGIVAEGSGFFAFWEGLTIRGARWTDLPTRRAADGRSNNAYMAADRSVGREAAATTSGEVNRISVPMFSAQLQV